VDVFGYFLDDAPPTGVDDSETVAEDAATTTFDVLANDTDPDGGLISVSSVTQPANGTVVITSGGDDLTYQPNADYCNAPPGTTPDTFTYTVLPGGSTATVSVTVTCVNDAPVVGGAGTVAFAEDAPPVPVAPVLTVADVDDVNLESALVMISKLLDTGAVLTAGGGSPTFTEDGPAVAVDPGLVATDADDANLESATAMITNLLDTGTEVLTAPTAGTAIGASYTAPTLTLTGTDTVAHYQQVLRSVAYLNSSQNPSSAARSIAFVANDGTANSNTATTVVNVTPVNDAPVLVAGGGGAARGEHGGPLHQRRLRAPVVLGPRAHS
jgi:VCBS repeat-containing protein